jgi:hypothetical protein
MVTVLTSGGFRIVIYLDAPAHVHVRKGLGEAKINPLGDDAPALEEAVGLKNSEVRRAMRVIEENLQAVIDRWEEIHGETD